ncbi:uncharacterized protein N7483_010262 [Penicillium malachiteum]|uniref:uncharacterized protein n=1 Tax=Penicillium malachiteum TaxID=1324776 RepID=UPI0025478140|nr:uncharacterized protein N7483_010262 [Penicillium malachiteum]KAJ5713081.1 hypothetical protein N7483_010262 [Penicillium malachiteum]
MSQESAEDTDQSWERYFHPAPAPPPNIRSQPARLPPMRYPRDGFDFRRPAGTPAQEDNVIDLTNEPETPPQRTQTRTTDNRPSSSSRPPRFGRPILAQEIVDLDDEPDNPAEGHSSSPEVQFLSASVRPPPRTRHELEARFHAAIWGSSVHRNNPRARQISSEVAMSLPSSIMPFRGAARNLDTLFYGQNRGLGNSIDHEDSLILDYGLASFSMDPSTETPEDRRRETYKAPSPVPEGFTRTLADDDVAICPNCSNELGVGEGKKQEIWVAKPCGHVYCGECAENRSKSKAKKTNTAQRTKPFSKCQVADCGKPVSAPTAMIHLYL